MTLKFLHCLNGGVKYLRGKKKSAIFDEYRPYLGNSAGKHW